MGHSITLELDGKTLKCFPTEACNFQNIDANSATQEELGITHNNSKMFYKACEIAGLHIDSFGEFLDGSVAKDIYPNLEVIVSILMDHKEDIEPLAPTNGWGGYTDLTNKLLTLYRMCLMYPEAIIRDFY